MKIKFGTITPSLWLFLMVSLTSFLFCLDDGQNLKRFYDFVDLLHDHYFQGGCKNLSCGG